MTPVAVLVGPQLPPEGVTTGVTTAPGAQSPADLSQWACEPQAALVVQVFAWHKPAVQLSPAMARAGRVAEIERIKKGQAGRGGTIQTSGRTGAADAAAGPAGSAADTGRIGPRASRIVEANTRIAGRAPNDLRRNISRKK
jgi:hypothetical protein